MTVRSEQMKYRMINGEEGVSPGYVLMFLSFNGVTAIVRFFILNDPNLTNPVSVVLRDPYFVLFKLDSFSTIASATFMDQAGSFNAANCI